MASVFARKLAPELPALSGLDGRDLDEAFAAFIPCTLGPGETLMDPEDDESPTLVVISGALSLLTDGRPSLKLTRLHRGDVVGGGALHSGDTPSARLVTEGEVHVMLLEPAGAEWLKSVGNPALDSLQSAALQTSARALRGANQRLTSMAKLPSAPVSTAPPSFLQKLTGRFKRPRSAAPHPSAALASGPAFSGADPVAVGWLADRMTPIALRDGEAVQIERSGFKGAWLVAEGALVLSRDITAIESDEMTVLGPGGVAGLPGLIDGDVSPLTCTARGPTWVYAIPEALGEAILTDPSCRPLRAAMLQALSAQIRVARQGLNATALEARRGAINDRTSLRATSAALWSVPTVP